MLFKLFIVSIYYSFAFLFHFIFMVVIVFCSELRDAIESIPLTYRFS